MFNLYLLNSHYFQSIYWVIYKVIIKLMGYGLGGRMDRNGEEVVLKSILLSKSNPVLFDVGANRGSYSRKALEVNGSTRIHAFEPNYKMFEIVQQKFINFENVILNNCALGESNMKGMLFVPDSKDSLGSVHKRRVFSEEVEIQTIRIQTLDTYISENGIEGIDLLKLDVEGHELSVLKGALQTIGSKAIRNIQFEFGGCNIDSRTFFRDFWELLFTDYNIYKITSTGLFKIEIYTEQLEIFSTVNFLAILKNE